MNKPIVHLVATMGVNGQIGIGGTVPWIGEASMMESVASATARVLPMCQNGVWIVGPSSFEDLGNLRSQLAPKAMVALYHPRHHDPEDFLCEVYEHTDGEKEFWVMGGARTFSNFMPFVDFHHINVVPYNGPADEYLRPLIPGWVAEQKENSLC